jgi:hypothetical protein
MDARTGVKFGVTSRITATELARVWCVASLAFFLDFSRNRPGPLLSRTGAQAPENAKRTRAASPSSQVEPAVKARHPLPKKDYMSLREIWRAQRPARPENTSPERKKARAPGLPQLVLAIPLSGNVRARVSAETGLSVWCGLNFSARRA